MEKSRWPYSGSQRMRLSRARIVIMPSPSKRPLQLSQQFILHPLVARRKMKRDYPGGSSLTGKQPRLEGGQVIPVAGPFAVSIQKCRLYEEAVGSAGKIDDSCHVCRGIGGIGNVGDFLSGNDLQDSFFQLLQDKVAFNQTFRSVPPHPKALVIGLSPDNIPFQLRQPWPGR